MKRLTKYLASGAADYNYPADCYGGNDCNDRAAKSAYRQTCVERLAAYEDTGLTPEEVLPKDKADEIALKLMRLADLESFCSYDRLRELAEADKDGRVAVLPRRVGDIVWANLDGMRHPPQMRDRICEHWQPRYDHCIFCSRWIKRTVRGQFQRIWQDCIRHQRGGGESLKNKGGVICRMVAQVSLASIMATISMVGKEQNYAWNRRADNGWR